ncbi:hypothetical protein SprV_0401639700 [Sparganum proliferum]
MLGYTQRRRSDWTSGRALQLSAQTARVRSRNDSFHQPRKMTSKPTRDDRKQYWVGIATFMEQASDVGGTRKFYQLIRRVSAEPSTLSDSDGDVNGGLSVDNSVKVERWREHFKHHLNFDTQTTTPMLFSAAEFLPSPTYAVSCDPLLKEKSPMLHESCATRHPERAAYPLKSTRPVSTLWRPGSMRKGDKTRCENYRGISLIDVAAIFAIVLLGRLQAVRDSRTRPNRTGFRARRGYAEQVHTLRRILEFCRSYRQPTAVCFVDFAAAFDYVYRESLWRIMAPDSAPPRIIAMIKAYYRSTTARILVHNNPNRLVFGLTFDRVVSCRPFCSDAPLTGFSGRPYTEVGVEFASGHRLADLDYADDIALLASSFGDLQSMVSRVDEVAKSVGLSINAGKAKALSGCIPDQWKAPLETDGCQLAEVDSFKYFRARLLPNGQSKDDIVSRIDVARWVFSSLRKGLWIRRYLSIDTKIRVYRASVRSVLLYGCECWALRVKDERKLEVLDSHCLRIILRVKYIDFVSKETVRTRCNNTARISQAIQERRLRWSGHVLRRPFQELSTTALDPAPLPHWGRRRGGQHKIRLDSSRHGDGSWTFGLRRWPNERVELSRSVAVDRHSWRSTVRDVIEAG